MKKRITGIVSAMCMLASVPTAFAADDAYATREYLVSEFVQSVGRSNLESGRNALNAFTDADEIDDKYVNDFECAYIMI